MVDAYIAGATLVELAERFGVHRRTAAAHLCRRGVSLRTRGLEPGQADEAHRLYTEGLTLIEVGLRFGVSQQGVRRALAAEGVEIRPAGAANRQPA